MGTIVVPFITEIIMTDVVTVVVIAVVAGMAMTT